MVAQVIIVDERDREIGLKARNEILQTDIYRVAALWLFNEKGEVLIAKRALGKAHDPGKWASGAAGTVEEGETYASNIVKEASEELGLRLETVRVGPCDFIDNEHRFFCQWFWAVIPSDTEFLLQEEEVAEVRWISSQSLAAEVAAHPERYVISMKEALESLASLPVP